MGYTTKFKGAITLSRPLTFGEARKLLEFHDDPDIIAGQHPGSYLQWVPTESLDGIVWDGGEKFYEYTEWMQWLVKSGCRNKGSKRRANFSGAVRTREIPA